MFSCDPRAVCKAEQWRKDSLRWDDRLIAFNELFWHCVVLLSLFADQSYLTLPICSLQLGLRSSLACICASVENLCVCVCGFILACVRVCVRLWVCVLCVITEAGRQADTTNGERCTVQSTRSFQLLSCDSDIQEEWWSEKIPALRKMTGRKRALFQREGTLFNGGPL